MADEIQDWTKNPLLLAGVVKKAEAEQSSLFVEARGYLRCYYDRPVAVDLNWTHTMAAQTFFTSLKNTYGGNLTREVVDAAIAMVCRPLSAEVTPKGTEHELEMGCKEASRLIEGVFDNSNFLGVAKEAARDWMTAHNGYAKGWVDKQNEEIRFERVDPLSVRWVNDGNRLPRTLWDETAVPIDVLIDRYPAKKAKIKELKRWSPRAIMGVDPQGTNRNSAETVKVVDAVARALGPNTPGRHVVLAGDDLILEDDPWTHEVHHIIAGRWQYDFRGYAGLSLARIINRYDSANRRLLRMVYASLGGAVPQLLEHEDCETDGPSDQEFGRWTWSGTNKPEIVIPQVVSPDIIGQIEKNYVRGYAEGGVNQNMATGSAPTRYTSGAAQREFVDIANTRLIDAQQQWQQFWTDASKLVVVLAQQAKKTHVKVKGANYYELVAFPDLPKNKFKVGFGLTSGMSLTPAGRLDQLDQLQKLGVADTPDVARGLSDLIPDIRALSDRLNAPRDLLLKQIGMALDRGAFSMPSAMQGQALVDLVRIGGEKYQEAMLRGNVPRKNLEVLRRLIVAAKARLAPPPAPANDVAALPAVPTTATPPLTPDAVIAPPPALVAATA